MSLFLGGKTLTDTMGSNRKTDGGGEEMKQQRERGTAQKDIIRRFQQEYIAFLSPPPNIHHGTLLISFLFFML